jgi:hypothetical protein
VRSIPSNGRRGPKGRGPNRAAGALAAALCATLLTACGGSPKASAGGAGAGATNPTTPAAAPLPADRPQKPACGLLTAADVEAAIGAKVNPGKEDALPGRSVCSFSLATGADQTVLVVSTSSSQVPASFDAARQRSGAVQTVNAGDQAFVADAQGFVRKGDTMVAVVLVLRRPAAELGAAATKLLQAAATHL